MNENRVTGIRHCYLQVKMLNLANLTGEAAIYFLKYWMKRKYGYKNITAFEK